MGLFRRTPRRTAAPAPGAADPAPSGRSGPSAPAAHEVVLLTKPGCHLCHKARATVARITAEAGTGFRELNILDDEALRERYWDKIPVTLVDDRVLDVWHVDEDRLRAALR